MARLNAYTVADSEDELPDLKSLILGDAATDPASTQPPAVGRKAQRSPRKGATSSPKKVPEKQQDTTRRTEGRKLKAKDDLHPASRNIVRLPAPADSPKLLWPSSFKTKDDDVQSTVRSSPRRDAKAPVNYTRLYTDGLSDSASSIEEDDSFTDLSGFIVSDSESVTSEEVNNRKKEQRKRNGGTNRGNGHEQGKGNADGGDLTTTEFLSLSINDTEPSDALPRPDHHAKPLRVSDASEPDDGPAIIK